MKKLPKSFDAFKEIRERFHAHEYGELTEEDKRMISDYNMELIRYYKLLKTVRDIEANG